MTTGELVKSEVMIALGANFASREFKYCCQEYVNLLQGNNIKISISEFANPCDNAKI